MDATAGLRIGDLHGELAGTDESNPYPALAEARATTPVVATSPMSFLVFRHDDVARVLRDGDTYSSSVLGETMAPVMGDRIILGMDEPEHRLHRALVGTAFRQKTLARWEVDLVRNVVDELIDGFVGDGTADGRVDLVPSYTF